MITNIKIPLKEYKFKDETDKEYEDIQKLSKVNIFVGPNNSGKSRFMRSIASSDNDYKTDYANIEVGNHNIQTAIKEIRRVLSKYGLNAGSINGLAEVLTGLEKPVPYLNKNNATHNLLVKLKKIIDDLCIPNTGHIFGSSIELSAIGREIHKIIYDNQTSYSFGFDKVDYLKLKDYKVVYIPMLRGLRPLLRNQMTADSENEANTKSVYTKLTPDNLTPFSDYDCFRDRTIYDYFNPEKNNLYHEEFNKKFNFEIFTGLRVYYEIKRMLLGLEEEREFIGSFQKFLGDNFFDGDNVTLIPNIDSDVLYIKIGKQKERPIHELGDGLQTIIIAVFPVYKYMNENLLFFIEEPELTLHPGLQRKLVGTYCNNFKNCQVFITTHSNHFLDISLDFEKNVSIYSFAKRKDNEFIIKNISSNKDILDMLGIRNSSVFLSNCIIWVEGITDRLYIKTILELYQNENSDNIKRLFEEDKHYSIIEYGGGNITHFNFEDKLIDSIKINVENISKNNFIVSDNDNYDIKTGLLKDGTEKTPSEKGLRLKTLNETLKESFFAEHIEIENLIPFKVYEKYFIELPENKNRKFKHAPEKAKKDEFDEDLKNETIGNVLRKHFIDLKDGETSKNFDNNDISCIGDKKEIAIKLIEHIKKLQIAEKKPLTFKEFPQPAKDLITKIHEFIERNNKI